MPINHKFKEYHFTNEFFTQNAILVNTPYQPEILFLGTFNPNTDEAANMADFFYGRNWFWPILFNIFEYNQETQIKKQRRFTNPLNPSLDEVFQFMKKHKLSFADLIMQVFPDDEIDCLAANNIIINGVHYNLIKDGDLAKINRTNNVRWTTKFIIDYLNQNPSISQVYFTRKPVNPFTAKLQEIQEVLNQRGVLIKYLFTPSGQGLPGQPRNLTIMNQWLHSIREGFDNLDENWTGYYNNNN